MTNTIGITALHRAEQEVEAFRAKLAAYPDDQEATDAELLEFHRVKGNLLELRAQAAANAAEPVVHSAAPAEVRVSQGRQTVTTATRDRAASQFTRQDGRAAVVERGQRWADHEIVTEYASRRTVSERPVIDQHGSMGNLVRSMTDTSGSAVVPTLWASDIIDRARNYAAVLQAGAQLVPMDSRILQIGRLDVDPVSSFRAEGSTIAATDPSFSSVQLNAKSLNCLVVASVEFLQDSDSIGDISQEFTVDANHLQAGDEFLVAFVRNSDEIQRTISKYAHRIGENGKFWFVSNKQHLFNDDDQFLSLTNSQFQCTTPLVPLKNNYYAKLFQLKDQISNVVGISISMHRSDFVQF